MKMTLEQYIANPMGKSNAVLNSVAREAMRSNYKSRFDALMVREKGNIKYKLYYDEKKNRYFAHIKIPSETVEKFYYDTVIEFYTDSNVEEAGTNLLKYYTKFYSNDPAFVYTYAYVFSHNELFIEELKSKMSKKALKDRAEEKNPSNQVGYVKTIYFAYLFMSSKGFFLQNGFKAQAEKFVAKDLVRDVMDADTKIGDREAEGAKQQKAKKRKKDTEKREEQNTSKKTNSSKIISKTKVTSKIGGTKTTKMVKRK